ncbi:hypothetical protein BG58_39460 [Caballeronia jiangsuensis]|nr:hypothetical protein BG58_39460 [Caballeronia jiangsuensis]
MYEFGQRALSPIDQNFPAELRPSQGDAIKYLETAGAKGDTRAYVDLGEHYLRAKNTALGLSYLDQGKDSFGGQISLAYLYSHGAYGIPASPAAALEHYKKAQDFLDSNQKGALARQISEFYYYGIGVAQDTKKAFAIVAEYQDVNDEARSCYAWMMFRGEGTQKDEVQAVQRWLSLRVTRLISNPPYANPGLAEAYARGVGVQKDMAKAEEYMKISMFSPSVDQYWGTILATKSFMQGNCPLPFTVTESVFHQQYRSIAGKAYAEIARCYQDNAKREGVTAETFKTIANNAAMKFGVTPVTKAPVELKRNRGVSIGMTEDQALASNWGRPNYVNRTHTAAGDSSQWVYGGGNYLYFQNGRLTTIQN